MATGKGRKLGRNKVKCKKYKDENRRDKNKTRKLKKSVENIKKEARENVLRINNIGRNVMGENKRKKQKYNIKEKENV